MDSDTRRAAETEPWGHCLLGSQVSWGDSQAELEWGTTFTWPFPMCSVLECFSLLFI